MTPEPAELRGREPLPPTPECEPGVYCPFTDNGAYHGVCLWHEGPERTCTCDGRTTHGDQPDTAATDGACQVTPEMRRQDRKRARRQRVRFRLRLLWASTGYRPTMRLIHRLNWCWMEPTPVEPNRAWCHWCGMRGRR